MPGDLASGADISALAVIRPDDRHWFRARRRAGCRINFVMIQTECATILGDATG